MSESTADNPEDGGGGILGDPHHVRADAQLLARAVRERWPVPERKRARIVKKLIKVVEQETSTIMGEDGKPLEVSNARNQAACARVLVAMDGLNQSDDQTADKNTRLDAGKATDRVAVDPVVLERPVSPSK